MLVKFSNDSVQAMQSVAGTFIFYFSYFPLPSDFTRLFEWFNVAYFTTVSRIYLAHWFLFQFLSLSLFRFDVPDLLSENPVCSVCQIVSCMMLHVKSLHNNQCCFGHLAIKLQCTLSTQLYCFSSLNRDADEFTCVFICLNFSQFKLVFNLVHIIWKVKNKHGRITHVMPTD